MTMVVNTPEKEDLISGRGSGPSRLPGRNGRSLLTKIGRIKFGTTTSKIQVGIGTIQVGMFMNRHLDIEFTEQTHRKTGFCQQNLQ